MDRLNIHLADRQIKALAKISQRSGLPRAELVRRAIDEYLDRVSKLENSSIYCGYTGTSGDFKQ